jgi:DNA mismatch repair protein MutS
MEAKIKQDKNLTPLMKQYWDIKKEYPDMILMFRLGDFFEMFGDDAIKAHGVLELTLTQRNGVPMCGVPYRSLDSYLKKLINKGMKAAICDQMEEAQNARGLVKRAVKRVVTAGTVIEDNLLPQRSNNFLMAVAFGKNSAGYAAADISTGSFYAGIADFDDITSEIEKYDPGEILICDDKRSKKYCDSFGDKAKTALTNLSADFFDFENAKEALEKKFTPEQISSFGLDNQELIIACGVIMAYLEGTQKTSSTIFNSINRIYAHDFMSLDSAAVRNLELLANLADNTRQNSLLAILDSTQTPMGARLLRQWLIKPLVDKDGICARQNAVEFFMGELNLLEFIGSKLKLLADIERIAARIALETATPRDLAGLKISLMIINEMCVQLNKSEIFNIPQTCANQIIEKLNTALSDEPPVNLKDGNVIKSGFNKDLDELRQLAHDTRSVILETEQSLKIQTNIPNLKIGYNNVFGYFIEVTKGYVDKAPSTFIRKQTIANGERYITPELKDLEDKILSAQEKLQRLEANIFSGLRNELVVYVKDILALAGAAAQIDIFCSFAKNALDRNYCRPQINDGFDLQIEGGRHPVVESILKEGAFCANDVNFNDKERILILTGPNMGGKSTYLRQTALIVIMAQLGSYVPAQSAKIGIVDKVFTRIGASDNLAGGQSTFMVEMSETAAILKQYTQRSLIILDEVGRGTSTYDGISIAWAILEYIASGGLPDDQKPRMLFATHYFELTSLEQKYPCIVNFNVAVKEWNGAIVFLHRIDRGSAERSYGIYVAKIAGMPAPVVRKAYKILSAIEAQKQDYDAQNDLYPSLFAQEDNASQITKPQILIELENVDLDSISPLEAFNLLQLWKKKYMH